MIAIVELPPHRPHARAVLIASAPVGQALAHYRVTLRNPAESGSPNGTATAMRAHSEQV